MFRHRSIPFQVLVTTSVCGMKGPGNIRGGGQINCAKSSGAF